NASRHNPVLQNGRDDSQKAGLPTSEDRPTPPTNSNHYSKLPRSDGDHQMGVNDNDEAPQTREGASQNASRRPHAFSNSRGARRRGQAERVTGKRAEVAALQAQLRAAR